MRINSRNHHMGVLERTLGSNKKVLPLWRWVLQIHVSRNQVSLPVSSSLLRRCPYPAAHPLASHKRYSLQTVWTASRHWAKAPRNSLCCDFNVAEAAVHVPLFHGEMILQNVLWAATVRYGSVNFSIVCTGETAVNEMNKLLWQIHHPLFNASMSQRHFSNAAEDKTL